MLENNPQHKTEDSKIWNLSREERIPYGLKLFYLNFNEIPNTIKINIRFSVRKVVRELKKIYAGNIRFVSYYLREQKANGKRIKGSKHLAIINYNIIVDIVNTYSGIYFKNTVSLKEVAKIKRVFYKHKALIQEDDNRFYIITNSYGELNMSDFELREMDLLDLNLNYNDDLLEVHPKMQNFLTSQNKSGLILLHGQPGGGKTYYLRQLIITCKTKFIYFPNELFHQMNNPNFIDFISKYENSVIILEDCEDLLKPRTDYNSGNGISTLLNLADGLLGDALKIKVICTFNTELKNIDQTLLRKGRLFQIYEFKKLTVEKANLFLEKNNIDIRVTEPTSISDLYSIRENNGNESLKSNQQTIGFNKN